MDVPEVLEELGRLGEMRHRDPAEAMRRTEVLLGITPAEPLVQARGRWVLGLAAHQLGEVRPALRFYGEAVELAVEHGFTDVESVARGSMAISLLTVGDAKRAEVEIERAVAIAPPAERGFVALLYGLVLQRSGRLDEALVLYQRAGRLLRAAPPTSSLPLLELNVGTLRAYRGDRGGGLMNYVEAERLATELELPRIVAMAAHNSGFALGRRGSLPEALAAFDRARMAYKGVNDPRPYLAVLEADRCEVFLLAGLTLEARNAAAAAVAQLDELGDVADSSETRLLLARAWLAEGEPVEASREARLAARAFRAAHRRSWAALADYVAIQAEVMVTEEQRRPPARLLPRARRIAVELEQQGWPVEAVHVRTFVGRIALALGKPTVAEEQLERAAAARHKGTADLRAKAWHATALLRLAREDESGAKRALVRGLAVIDDHRATLGATELRAQAASHGAELARLGLWLALRDGRPIEVLRWSERWRAGSLRLAPVRPPVDQILAAMLVELRQLHVELREASLEGRPTGSVVVAVERLEHTVRRRVFEARADGQAAGRPFDEAELRERVGSRALVEFVALEGELHAVTVHQRRVELRHLGPVSDVVSEQTYLLSALRRLGAATTPASEQRAFNALRADAARLDQLLLAPLALPDDAPIVIVPTGSLHGMPWAALASLRRPTTIAPSAALWSHASAGRARHESTVALIAGPELSGADAEVVELAGIHRGATVLRGADASASKVLDALERSRLVHIAAHGRFRADSPLFSSVLLADGPLTLYDLDSNRSPPAMVVMPSCEAALADVRLGDELLGTAAALIGLGVGTVIAPVVEIPDEGTAAVMLRLHHALRAGQCPGAALATAVAETYDVGVGAEVAAASAFVSIGVDDAALALSG